MLLELGVAHACLFDEKDNVDTEDAPIAPTASDEDAIRLAMFDLVFLAHSLILANGSGEQLFEVGASVLA